MAVRFNDRILARRLRQRGLTFSEIRARIPNLSKGTLSGWLKDIELSEKQKSRIIRKIRLAADKGRAKGAFKNHEKRVRATKLVLLQAKRDVDKKSFDPFFVSGSMLYWAEGRKSAEVVEMTNSDPKMIAYMMKWFRECCRVEERRFRARINIHSLLNKAKVEKFWSEIAGIPLSQFNKTVIKETRLAGKRNSRYLGTCSIIISDKELFRRILGWRLALVEKFLFRAPVAQLDRASEF